MEKGGSINFGEAGSGDMASDGGSKMELAMGVVDLMKWRMSTGELVGFNPVVDMLM